MADVPARPVPRVRAGRSLFVPSAALLFGLLHDAGASGALAGAGRAELGRAPLDVARGRAHPPHVHARTAQLGHSSGRGSHHLLQRHGHPAGDTDGWMGMVRPGHRTGWAARHQRRGRPPRMARTLESRPAVLVQHDGLDVVSAALHPDWIVRPLDAAAARASALLGGDRSFASRRAVLVCIRRCRAAAAHRSATLGERHPPISPVAKPDAGRSPGRPHCVVPDQRPNGLPERVDMGAVRMVAACAVGANVLSVRVSAADRPAMGLTARPASRTLLHRLHNNVASPAPVLFRRARRPGTARLTAVLVAALLVLCGDHRGTCSYTDRRARRKKIFRRYRLHGGGPSHWLRHCARRAGARHEQRQSAPI